MKYTETYTDYKLMKYTETYTDYKLMKYIGEEVQNTDLKN
jgi:hypothetical protein